MCISIGKKIKLYESIVKKNVKIYVVKVNKIEGILVHSTRI